MQININIDKLVNTAGLKRALRSKTLIGSVIFAIALWIYTSLNYEYNTTVKVPLQVNLPSDRSLEKLAYDDVIVNVHGTGWQLFNLYFFNSTKNCLLDLTEHDFRVTDDVEITRSDLMSSLAGMVNVEAKDVNPTGLKLKTGLLQSKYIKIKPMINIVTREGFMVVGDVIVEPDSVLINGNSKYLDEIEHWDTEEIIVKNVFSPVNSSVSLKDTLHQIEIDLKSVKYKVDIQQIAEITVPDVAVELRGGRLPLGHTISPYSVEVTIFGGVDQLSDFDQTSINAFVELSDVKIDSTGIVKIHVNYPDDVKLLRINPPYIYHSKSSINLK